MITGQHRLPARTLGNVTTTAQPPATGPIRAGSGPRIRPMRYEPLGGEPCVVLPLPPPPPPAPAVNAVVDRDERLAPSARTCLLMLLEVLDGRRPANQLADRLSPAALRYLRAAATARRTSVRSTLSSLRICRPGVGVGEVAAVCRLDGRARAVAARFERAPDGAWRCVALRLG